MESRRLFSSLLVGAALSGANASYSALDLDSASNRAYAWMVSTRTTGGLYNSQVGGAVCYTYDQAVTVVAFIVRGDTARARQLLEKLQSLQGTDGSWFTGFDGAGTVSDGSQKWLGPMMWVDIAAAFYKKVTGSTQFDVMAKKNLDYALKTQAPHGGLILGQGYSTEENCDAYAALMAFGYTAQAAKVASFLNLQWNASQKRFNVGEVPPDPAVFLDPQTWGIQALGSAGPAEAPKALDFVIARMRCTKSDTNNRFTVDGFDFNEDKDDVWLEGTAQMASAFYTVGRPADGDHFLQEVAKSQNANGGIPYSVRGGTAETGEDYWEMTTALALSSSGWFIIGVSKVNALKPYGEGPASIVPMARRSGRYGATRTRLPESLIDMRRDLQGRRMSKRPGLQVVDWPVDYPK